MAGVAHAAFEALGQVPDPDDAAELAAVRAATMNAGVFTAEFLRGRAMRPQEAFGEPLT
ncbi:hypothetical protein AB0368_08860 [Actinoplanes sp. NPDC051475]|uniref:hypothetical protein n=1 Tax=Actinoplanes sp. NPDC051475 TaxID=3157225 RepID=UPI00344BC472